MENAANLNSVITGVNKEEPVVADPESQLLDSVWEPFEIADAGCSEAMQGGQNPHRGGFVERSDIALA
jgi:hypothetical protein